MELKIEFYNKTDGNLDEYERLILEILKEAIVQEGMTNEVLSCNYIFVDNQMIKEMNAQFRGKDYATDVLTFVDEDAARSTNMRAFKTTLQGGTLRGPRKKFLGDVFISLEKASQQAEEYGHSMKRELCFLAVHGFLHLLGYDHLDAESEREMFRRQEAILDAKGIKR